MLPVYVCDDNLAYRRIITNTINLLIEENQFDMKVVCATNSEKEILKRLKERNERSLYFLDLCIDKNPTDGYRLASLIRKYDSRGYVVVITSHENYMDLSFRHRTEIMDYIVKGKDNMNERILACLEEVSERMKSKNGAKEKADGEVEIRTKSDCLRLRKWDVYYIRRSGRRSNFNGETLRYAADATLEEISGQLDDTFCQCHRSYIVNLDHITEINKGGIVLDNGEELPVARNKVPELQNLLE